VFAALAQHQAGALLICPDVFFNAQIEQFAALGIRHAVPVVYQYQTFVKAGGLLSYGRAMKQNIIVWLAFKPGRFSEVKSQLICR
jgi:putative ABC transport system substrate-binding protein